MNIKEFRLIQHRLIPLALIAGNMALVHAIYLLAQSDNGYSLLAVVIGLLLLTIGIIRSNKYLLLTGVVFYVLIFLLEISL